MFSVLAICVAIVVPWRYRRRQHKAEAALERLKARSLALLATGACKQVVDGVGEVLELKGAGTHAIFFGEAARRAAKVPEELRRLIPQLPMLGRNGALLQDLILVLQGIESMQHAFDRKGVGHLRDPDDAFPFIGEQFELAMRLAEEIELRLSNLFDMRPLDGLDLAPSLAAPDRHRRQQAAGVRQD
ncbi:hypothetical protein [Pseudoxanthomonas sp.]|uniref:hypothetical protein n=1 Tax=Pseudoxanthomonas sp. TaxID=1871049 RepID=UPI00261B4C27|nr:hypothetical protein [Pseudoxanthomonas sp.]WDS36614.1 MAG: hypothetical protein O8I58_01445 [Pseudoxanthomonas sp.]